MDQICELPVLNPATANDQVVWRHAQADYRDSFHLRKCGYNSELGELINNNGVGLSDFRKEYHVLLLLLGWLSRIGFQYELLQGVVGVSIHVFCAMSRTKHETIFFSCPFSFTIWFEVVCDLLGDEADPS